MIWLVIAACLTLVCTPFFYQPFWLIKIISRIFKNVVFYIPTKSNYFALTFDDGPNPPYTNKILKILDRYHAKATFFVIGRQVEKYPNLLKLMLKKGHEVGNHFYDSWPSIFLTRKQLEDSLDRTEKLIRRKDIKFVRPSSMFFNPSLPKLMRTKRFKIVLGSAYTSDWTYPPRWYMRWALAGMLRPGIILVLHDGRVNRQRTVDVLPYVLQEAKKRNFKAVTLGTLFKKSTKQYNIRRQ